MKQDSDGEVRTKKTRRRRTTAGLVGGGAEEMRPSGGGEGWSLMRDDGGRGHPWRDGGSFCLKERGREIRGRGEQGKNRANKGGAHLQAPARCWFCGRQLVTARGRRRSWGGGGGAGGGERMGSRMKSRREMVAGGGWWDGDPDVDADQVAAVEGQTC